MSSSTPSSPSLPPSSRSSSSAPSLSPPSTPPNLHQNSVDPAAQWLVQKYGGTSVGKFAAKIAEEIVPCAFLHHQTFVHHPNILAATILTSTKSLLSVRHVQAPPRRWARPTYFYAPHLRPYNDRHQAPYLVRHHRYPQERLLLCRYQDRPWGHSCSRH